MRSMVRGVKQRVAARPAGWLLVGITACAVAAATGAACSSSAKPDEKTVAYFHALQNANRVQANRAGVGVAATPQAETSGPGYLWRIESYRANLDAYHGDLAAIEGAPQTQTNHEALIAAAGELERRLQPAIDDARARVADPGAAADLAAAAAIGADLRQARLGAEAACRTLQTMADELKIVVDLRCDGVVAGVGGA